MKSKRYKKEKGSVLIFTLFVMVLILVTGVGLISVSISGRRSTLSSGKSINSFQIADSGLEAALKIVKDASASDSISAAFGGCNTDDEFHEENISDGEYRVTFWDDTDTQLECSETIADIKKIKSTGIYRNTTRSVETNFTD